MSEHDPTLPVVPERDCDPDDEAETSFVAFVQTHGYSGDDIQRAYEILLGVDTHEHDDDRARLDLLVSEMRRLEAQHFSLTRFAEVIHDRREFEHAFTEYDQVVDQLPTDAGGKEVLRSIVTHNRSGVLTFDLYQSKRHVQNVRFAFYPKRPPFIVIEQDAAKLRSASPVVDSEQVHTICAQQMANFLTKASTSWKTQNLVVEISFEE